MAAEIRILINSQLQGGAIQQVNQDLREMDKTARDSSGGFSVLSGAAAAALGGVVVQAAGAAASAIGGFISSSVSNAGNFQAAMNQFAAAAGGALGDTQADVDKALAGFQDLFLELGAKLPVSTAEVQEAAIALVKGGMEPAIIAAGGLESSLQFAAAAGMGLAAAAELGVKMLATFAPAGATAAEKTQLLADAQNLLVKAAGASTVNVDELGNAMLVGAGQAQAMGLSVEDFTTSMGLLSNTMPSAAEAGTSFKNFLTRLAPTTKTATNAMIEIGLATEDGASKFFDAQGKFIGVRDAAQLLQDSLSGLSDKQRIQALTTIFGNDAAAAANALAKGGADAYEAFAAQMEKANGVSGQAAATQQGLNNAWTNFMGTIESVQTKLGLALMPTLEQVVNIANGLINAVMGDSEAFSKLSPVLQTVVTFVQNLAAQFMAMLPTIMMVAGVIAANWQPIMIGVGAVIGAVLIPALVAFAIAMAPVIAAIGAAIAIGMALYNAWNSNFMGIQQLVTAAMTAIQALITQVLFAVQLFWRQNGEQIMAFVAYMWGAIQGIIGTLAAAILQLVVVVFGGIATFFATHGALIQGIMRGVWQAISTIIQQALTIIQGITTTVLGVLRGNWSQAMEGIKMIISGLGIHISAQMKYVLDAIMAAGPQLLSAAITIGKGIIDGMVSGISGGIGGVVKAAVEAATAAIKAAKDALGIKSPSTVFANIGLNTSLGMAQGIASGAPMVAGAASGLGGAAVAAASNSVSSSSTRIVNYSPTYNRATNSPNSDRAIAAALAGV